MTRSKYILYGIIAAALIGVAVLITSYIRNSEQLDDLQKVIREKNTQIVKIKDDHNIEMNEREASFASSEIVYRKEKDSLAKLLKVKPKTITQYISANTSLNADINPDVQWHYKDSTKVSNIDSIDLRYKDQFIAVTGVVKPHSANLKITGEDSLTFVWLREGENIKIRARNTNEYIKLKGASSLTIKDPKESILQTSAFAGAGYDPIGRKVVPVVGVGVTVNIKRALKAIF